MKKGKTNVQHASNLYSAPRRRRLPRRALGLRGNWKAESGLEPCRLQNDFSANRIYSHAYTADVTTDRISRTQFARDQKGYGLAQWTYFSFSTGQGRKLELYDFWKKSGKALDDVSMQVSFALHELTTEAQYAGLWQILRTTDDIWTATDKVCRLYEQPYYCNVDTRFRYAKELDERLSAMQSGSAANPFGTTERSEALSAEKAEIASAETTAPTDSADLQATEEAPSDPNSTLHSALSTLYYPYRMIDKSMAGTDVAVLQAILTARGYYTGPLDGIFGDALDAAVRKFQSEHDLEPDGVVGPLSWRKILSLEE